MFVSKHFATLRIYNSRIPKIKSDLRFFEKVIYNVFVDDVITPIIPWNEIKYLFLSVFGLSNNVY